MFQWNKIPFLRLFLPLILGIAFAMVQKTIINIPVSILFISFVATSLSLIFTDFFFKRNRYWIAGFLLNIFLFISAYELIQQNNDKNNPSYYGNLLSDTDLYTVKVIEAVAVKQNSTKAVVKVEAVTIKGVWHATNGKGIIFFEKSALANNLNYGDQLIINSKFEEVKAPLNPNEFNYKSFLANKHIYYQSYVKNFQWKKIASNKGNVVVETALRMRKHFLKIFEENNMNGREYAVIGAILLGQTDHIDAALFKEYQGSGAVHVLVVAGLHVGIILLLLNFLLAFLDRYKYGKYFKTAIIVIVIWFYALMTGLSPPVVRAAIMFTFVSIGRNTLRSLNTINLLLASAFFVLIFNPDLLVDVGFQLSYIAVAGIVLLQKPIASIWHPSNFIINKLWQVTALSIAAQLATLPLTLLYFHQFPNLFLFTNLVVFLFATVIIFTGIAVLLSSWFTPLCVIIIKILIFLISAMNASIHFIETFPNAVTHSISFTALSCMLLYLFIAFLLIYLLMKLKKMLLPATIVLILMLMNSFYNNYQHQTQSKIIVYDINKTSAINLIKGTQSLMLADSIVIYDQKKFNFQLENNYTQMGIHSFTNKIINHADFNNLSIAYVTDNFIQFNNTTIVLINKPVFNNYYGKKLKIDYLILSKNARVKIKDLLNMFDVDMLIFDSSNYLSQTLKWTAECDALKVKSYNVLLKGAFIKEF